MRSGLSMDGDSALKVCQKCKASCCKLAGADFTKEEMQRVLKAGHPDHFVKLNENHYETKCKNGICPYLNTEG